jgi:hypothetical protein
MNRMDQFIGGGFTWFTGVVEDRFDPLEMNRVKVRCFGFHTENKGTIDVDNLPWATVMLPTTSSGTSGIGDTPHGLMEGSWVVGFFRDGVSAQDPIIMGTIASQNSPRSKSLGFTGDHYPLQEYQNESDINFAGRQAKYSASDQMDIRAQGSSPSDIQIAVPAQIPSVSDNKADAYYAESPWNELPPMNGHIPDYPYNKVNQSESGHVTEIDDTPGNERTHRMHTSGSYEEIYTDGTRQVKIVGDDYEVVFSNKNIHIKGNCSMTVDGDLRQMVYGNYHLQVEKDMTMNIKGSLQQKIGGNHEAEIVRSRSTNIGVDDNLSVMNNSTTNTINDKLLTVGNDFTTSVTNNMATTVLNNKTVMNAGTFSHTSLADYTLSVNANQIIGVVGTLGETIDGAVTETYSANQTTNVTGILDIDASTSMTIDSPDGSIDLPAGNITSNNVTLHTHTHTEVPGSGGASSPSPATQPTTAPISGT